MPLCGAACKLDRCEPVKARVGPLGVIVQTPMPDYAACLVQTAEQVLVQAFVAKAADEAFCKAVLHRLARRDVVPFDFVLLLPSQDRVRGQLGAIVADDQAGMSAKLR